ncbi:hypothetical protein ACFFQF_31850 [Haladaptatus pallidirubidus]|uniref:Uncharacterized protein n=1 Tax=Haladaptatus pallidirubidus TaxID=1008152 RepID=A0AAV3UP76_9EURY|nr:hypothetical protein [Haladaptatus pallidirubidus]
MKKKLEGANSEIAEVLGIADSSTGSVTYRLVEDTQTVCWICGSEVEKSSIKETLNRLQEPDQQKCDRRRELEDEIDDIDRAWKDNE